MSVQRGAFRRWGRTPFFVGVTFILGLVGCGPPSSGSAELAAGDSGRVEGSSGAETSNGSDFSPDEVESDDGTRVDCSTLERPPTPLRRLTRFEYDNSVRDLLHTELKPAASFPPDEVADGFSNNALVLTISSLHAEKYTLAAEALASEAVGRLADLFPCDATTRGADTCAEEFARTFGRRAFRRAVDSEDMSILMEAYGLGNSYERGIEIMIRTMLQSPHFLFRVEVSGSDMSGSGMVRLNGYETAARLSYLIWSSIPDDQLLDAAAASGLSEPEQVAEQARRMLRDPKAKAAVNEFYRQWLETNRLSIVAKDVKNFPLWSEAMRVAMQKETDAVVSEVVFGSEPTLKRLLTAPLGLPTGPLAELYDVPESDQVSLLPRGERAGVMTLPGFLAVQAHPDQTSPVLRGKFVREKLLCKDVSPPPDNVDISAPDPKEGGTARERFSRHAEEATCAECHSLMDPLGYPFESYDAIGTFRTTDQGQTMDLSGEFVETKSMDGPFDGLFEMVSMLSEGEEVTDCVATQWFKYSMGRGIEAGDLCSVTPLQDAFARSDANLFELIVQTTQSEAFLYRRASSAGATP